MTCYNWIFAMSKDDFFTTSVINKKAPSILVSNKPSTEFKNCYWIFYNETWEDDEVEYQEIRDYIEFLEQENIEYGLVKMDEDAYSDEELGSPWLFDIQIIREIHCPTGST